MEKQYLLPVSYMHTIKQLKGLILLFTIIFSFQSASAQFLIISDIDDTIKESSTLKFSRAVVRAFSSGHAVQNMAFLYHQLVSIPDSLIYYVSNAPYAVMGDSHDNFLEFNSFPRGFVHLRNIFDQPDEHKKVSLLKVITDVHPHQVLLIGDNASWDQQIYREIVGLFPSIKFYILIRDVNPDAPRFEDVDYFKTALDAAEILYGKYILEDRHLQNMIDQIPQSISFACEQSFN